MQNIIYDAFPSDMSIVYNMKRKKCPLLTPKLQVLQGNYDLQFLACQSFFAFTWHHVSESNGSHCNKTVVESIEERPIRFKTDEHK